MGNLGRQLTVHRAHRRLAHLSCCVFLLSLGCAGSVAYDARARASGWLVIETDKIELRTNPRRELALQLASDMQRAYDVVARHALPCARARTGATARVPVTVLQTAHYRELVRTNALGRYTRLGITWFGDDGQILLPDTLGVESRTVFQHELTHRLVESCFPAMPAWLNEGLAGFFETMVLRGDRVIVGRPAFVIATDVQLQQLQPSASVVTTDRMRGELNHRSRLTRIWLDGQPVWVVPQSALPSLDSMFRLTAWRSHDGGETLQRYAAAWALVHLLVVGAPELRPRFEAYLGKLQVSGANALALFTDAFFDIPLQERLNAYVERGKFEMLQWQLPTAAMADLPPPRVRDMTEEESHLHIAWLAVASLGDNDRDRVDVHLATAKRHPATRDAAYLLAAYVRWRRDPAGADRELQEGLQGASNPAALLEARLDMLLMRHAPIEEVRAVAEQLRPLATTAGALCSLADAAERVGDRASATELADRARQLNPRAAWIPRCGPYRSP